MLLPAGIPAPEAHGPARTKVGENAPVPLSVALPEQLVGLELLVQSAEAPQPLSIGVPCELVPAPTASR